MGIRSSILRDTPVGALNPLHLFSDILKMTGTLSFTSIRLDSVVVRRSDHFYFYFTHVHKFYIISHIQIRHQPSVFQHLYVCFRRITHFTNLQYFNACVLGELHISSTFSTSMRIRVLGELYISSTFSISTRTCVF